MTYQLSPTGIYQPHVPFAHRDYEYAHAGFDTLWDPEFDSLRADFCP